TARRHLVPRPERDAGTRTEPRDRPGLRSLSASQRRRLRAREFKALAVLSLAIETPFIPAPAFARVNSSGNPEGLGPRFRRDERILSSSTGPKHPLALRCRRRSDAGGGVGRTSTGAAALCAGGGEPSRADRGVVSLRQARRGAEIRHALA